MTGLVPIRALALGAPGREPDLTGRPFMTAPQAGIVRELQGLHRTYTTTFLSPSDCRMDGPSSLRCFRTSQTY